MSNEHRHKWVPQTWYWDEWREDCPPMVLHCAERNCTERKTVELRLFDTAAEAGEWTIEVTRRNARDEPREHRVIYWVQGVQSRIFITVLRDDAEWLTSLPARVAEAERSLQYAYEQLQLANDDRIPDARLVAAEARVTKLRQALREIQEDARQRSIDSIMFRADAALRDDEA